MLRNFFNPQRKVPNQRSNFNPFQGFTQSNRRMDDVEEADYIEIKEDSKDKS